MVYLLGTVLLLAAGFGLYGFGFASVRRRGAVSTALPVAQDAVKLDRLLAPLLGGHAGQSGLKLVVDNMQAFAARAATARGAERSLDLQYYSWKGDLTGKLLLSEVLAAADRGVRVRLLVDDINVSVRDRHFRALAQHEKVEVRFFNPTRCRDYAILRGLELVVRFWRVNRRMHNKAWIVDGRVAIVGGRNIGDAYFDASEQSNFRDMDVLAVGPVVEQTSAIFDSFWNSKLVLPVRSPATSGYGLPRLRRKLARAGVADKAEPYLKAADHTLSRLAEPGFLQWTSEAVVLSDLPEKAIAARPKSRVLKHIRPVLMAARRRLAITSPYFIPRRGGLSRLRSLAQRGVSVSVLTNSLAATDVTAVHGAYARYRQGLVEGGAKLFELRPRNVKKDVSFFGSKGASLHTKAFVVDDSQAFVGSFNFDPRSIALNTEMGILFRSPGIAAEMLDVFEEEVSPRSSYRVVVQKEKLAWLDGTEGTPQLRRQEPEASLFRRILAWSVGKLPLESHL